ncbi:MAG: integrase core domain-containing protein [Candidatus Paceibacterota bacterium]
MYTSNPNMPKIRRDAVLFTDKHGVRKAARHFGFSPGAICVWRDKARKIGLHPIPTLSSRPKHHPKELSEEITDKIVDIRLEHNRSAEVVHKRLKDEQGIEVSLSSVKRTLDRRGLLRKRSPWKRFHQSVPRPDIEKLGDLVQVDTIHLMRTDKTRVYIFTCLDVYSRWTYARAYTSPNTRNAIDFLKRAQAEVCFTFYMIQSDNGPEFSTHFTERIPQLHRHSRVRRPNDNAHLERFNRTLQTEVDLRWPKVSEINRKLPAYLKWYNEERHHFGLNLETPLSVIKCSQGID